MVMTVGIIFLSLTSSTVLFLERFTLIEAILPIGNQIKSIGLMSSKKYYKRPVPIT